MLLSRAPRSSLALLLGATILAGTVACTSDVEVTSAPTLVPPESVPTVQGTPAPDPTQPPPQATANTLADDAPAPDTADPTQVQLALTPVATADKPVALRTHPVTGLLYVAQQGGQLLVVRDGATEVVLDVGPLITTEGNEQGLLGIEFSPDGTLLYVNYTDTSGATVVAEYAMPTDEAAGESSGGAVDPATARTILTIAQPFPNHNGGDLHFGPDGYLYIGMGDGGAGGDPEGNGQNPDTLLGAVLRIDPAAAGDAPYQVPSDNPYVRGGGRPEVFLIGVRNPWRFSFDRASGDLWIADVGQNEFEEVTVLRAADGGGLGANLGWSILEGDAPFNGAEEPAGYVGPVHVYGRDDGCSVTGGYVYRGSARAELVGTYVFADYCTGQLWGLVTDAAGATTRVDLGINVGQPSAFGQDGDGELYVADHRGTVYRIG